MQDYSVLERGWLSSNSIVFHEGEDTAVVDTGYCTHSTQTIALIDSTLHQRPLYRIVNTHLHSDHCGGNAALQQRYSRATTLIPPGLATDVKYWNETALSYQATGQHCPRFHHDSLLIPGDLIALGAAQWEIHAAPGHDPDSIILFEPQTGTLISADALWEHGFGVVFPELDQRDAFSEVLATLDLIERLAVKTVIPGHGAVFHDVASALLRARVRLEKFARNPISHARYAAKVLVKYKLLELQQCEASHLISWCEKTPYLHRLHAHFFADQPRHQWFNDILTQLQQSGAAQRQGDLICNHVG